MTAPMPFEWLHEAIWGLFNENADSLPYGVPEATTACGVRAERIRISAELLPRIDGCHQPASRTLAAHPVGMLRMRAVQKASARSLSLHQDGSERLQGEGLRELQGVLDA